MPYAAVLDTSASMKIVSIGKSPGSRERARLRMDDGSEADVAREILMREGLRAGDPIDREVLGRLSGEDLRWRAREAALRLLSHRPRTESELRQRLLRKDFPAAITDECIRGLREKGLLDDSTFAEMFARDRVRLNPRARRLVVEELRGRGVDPSAAEAAVDGVLHEERTDDMALARDSARRWRARRGEEPERARRRLTGFLARRGFSSDTVRAVADEVLGDG